VLIWLLAGTTVILIVANNAVNLIEGRPLHDHHKGIGW
jgi:hypothetical protein